MSKRVKMNNFDQTCECLKKNSKKIKALYLGLSKYVNNVNVIFF